MTHKPTQKTSPKTSAKVAHKPFVEYREGHCSSSNRAASEVSEHPCYSEQAHRSFGRVHVPVAPACNIQCNYCVRKYACPNENRPGVTVQVISPEQARTVVDRALTLEPRIRVIGIAGPGDALANEETLQTLEMARDEFPQLVRCMSTNGLLLPDKIDDLYRARVTSLTVTINAIDEEIGEQIYRAVRYRGKTYRGREAFELLSNNQLMGVKMAAERGMIVKVNSILMPGINDHHLVEVAKVVKELGAYIMNVMPFIPIPGAKFEDREPPSAELLEHVRNECSAVLRQFRSCTQCRADAVGVPGEDGCGGDHLQDQLYEGVCTDGHADGCSTDICTDTPTDTTTPIKGAFRAGLL